MPDQSEKPTEVPDDGGPAFPLPITGATDGHIYHAGEMGPECCGASLRDLFAAFALNQYWTHSPEHVGAEDIADAAYSIADAMLKRRKR